jgi:uncharacterized repeat protein (TIGR02543 family)
VTNLASSGTVTLTAQWNVNYADTDYWANITYNANTADAGEAPAVQHFIGGTANTLATNSGNLTKEGYSFAGWNTQADGNGTTTYAAGATATLPAGNHTLYAKWEASSLIDQLEDAEEGDEITFAGSGWRVIQDNYEGDSSKKLLQKINSLTTEEMAAVSITVGFHNFGNFFAGTGITEAKNTGYGVSNLKEKIDYYYNNTIKNSLDENYVLPVDLDLPTLADMKKTQGDGKLDNVYLKSESTLDSFVWNGDFYKDQDFATSLTEITSNDADHLPAGVNAFKKQAFTLSFGDINKIMKATGILDNRLIYASDQGPRYFLRSAGKNIIPGIDDYNGACAGFVDNNGVFNREGGTVNSVSWVRPALWVTTRPAQIVSLDREGGETGSENFQANYNSEVLTDYEAPTKSGFDFKGYYTGDNGTGQQVIDETGQYVSDEVTGLLKDGKWVKVPTPETTTLYAKWEADAQPATITFKNYYGTQAVVPQGMSVNTIAVNTGDDYTLPEAPAVDNQYFIGWAEEPNATKDKQAYLTTASQNLRNSLNSADQDYLGYVSKGTALNVEGDKTLYAVYYKGLGATESPSSNAPTEQEFIFANAIYRVLKADNNNRLVLKVNALTESEFQSIGMSYEVNDFGKGTTFHETSKTTFFSNLDASTGYGESRLKIIIDKWFTAYIAGVDRNKVLSVDLDMPTFTEFRSTLNKYYEKDILTEYYHDYNNYAGWYLACRIKEYKTSLTNITNDASKYNGINTYKQQAFALSFGDIHTFLSIDDDSTDYRGTLIGWNNYQASADGSLPEPNNFWLRSASFGNKGASGVTSGGFYTGGGQVDYVAKAVRPAMWLKIN